MVTSLTLRYSLFGNYPKLKGTHFFINENLILEDHVKLCKEVKKMKEARNIEKMAFIRNKKVVFLDQKMMDNCM
jgi:hypothetical protein